MRLRAAAAALALSLSCTPARLEHRHAPSPRPRRPPTPLPPAQGPEEPPPGRPGATPGPHPSPPPPPATPEPPRPSQPQTTRSCLASWYGRTHQGRRTASGERFDRHALTAAHRSLPFGTRLEVSHGPRSVVVRVTDRGPFVRGRCVDLSEAAFARLAPTSAGVIRVRLRVLP